MDRGRLLLQGLDERAPGGYTYRRQLSYLSFWLFLAFLASLLAYFSWDVPVAGSVALNKLFMTFVVLTPIIVLLAFVPLEIDGIWDEGLSGRRTMIHRLIGRTFFSYERIVVVQIDKMSWGARRWKRLTVKDHRNKISLSFGDREHSNGFYQEALSVLERRCPNARWLERYVYVTKWDREVTRDPGPEVKAS